MKYLTFFLLLSTLSSRAQIDLSHITIVRDKWGVPHIFGKTDADVAYGLAWANAEDSFEMIQEDYLNIKGLVGRMKGKEGAKIDYVVALIKAREVAAEKYQSDISPAFKEYIKAYVDGFNAYANAHPEQIICKELFPINEIDIITGYVISFAMMSKLGDVLESLFKGEIPTYSSSSTSITGSNGFAFNANKTVDSSAFLNINSHQPLEGVYSWYEAHLISEEGLNIYGSLFHGGLTINHGANENIGWAHTDNNLDLIDVYALEINPKNPNQYKYDGKWEELEVNPIKLKVKVAGMVIPIQKKVYWSKYGATLKTKDGMYSLRFAANMDIRGLEQWYWMNKAQNFTQFKRAIEMQAIPCFNIIYADRFDTIYFISNGMVPIRDSSYNWMALLPGNTSKTLWTQFHPLQDLPQVLNPDCGYVYNTNNSPFTMSCASQNLDKNKYEKTMGYEDIVNNRSLRFEELISEKDKITFDDFKQMKYDITLPDSIVPVFNIPFAQLMSMEPKDYPEIADELKLIQQWDRRADTNSIAATLVLLSGYYLKNMMEEDCKMYKHDHSFNVSCYLKAVKAAKKHLYTHFGTIQVPLGQVQRHVRGDKDLAIPGFPDVIAAMYCLPTSNGTYRTFAGESYIQLVRFSKEGTQIETINAYGASNHPSSSHYTDQMELFVKQKTKSVSLHKEVIFKEAERIYHPE